MGESFNYIENHDDSQFTLKELRDVLTGDPEEERLRIVEAAEAIIHEDIRSSVVETKSYPPPSKILIKENQKMPIAFLTGNHNKKQKRKNRRHGSERLIDVLYSLGFAASYGNTVQFEISTAYHPQPRILSLESSALVQYVRDNANIFCQLIL
ncbi:uncharacterized protein TNIN_386761 [Trichonephila inaurata madagascariensis]|uniref:Uncharacterized protein n=1 Tax=Trichonephila inaurata madagascariensis TaxID=2747483 RepID=A0A8X6MJI6_9ARAC|nr:uncharacterized protein TNIN_386761 [Trichonephila inaurata madagascariensis]